MRAMDVLISGGSVVTPTQTLTADVGISGGHIAAIGTGMQAARTLDATGCVVMPGLIDPHVHLSAPEAFTADEPCFADDFYSGSLAAIAGGVTTVGQMSFPLADEGMLAAIDRDARAAADQAAIDYFLHPATITASTMTLHELVQLAERGHRSFKMVTLAMDWDRRHLMAAVELAGHQGMVTLAHCEDQALIEFATDRLVAQNTDDAFHYPDSRPRVSESAAVERMIAVCEMSSAPLYVVHLSSRLALEACRRAKQRGLPVYVETRPLYLGALTEGVHAQPDGAKYAGMPPLRAESDIEALWAGLADGGIDTVGSDHAPWTLQQKMESATDLEGIRKGIAELETMLALLWTEGVRRQRISVERLVEVTSTTAARLFGLPGKGSIEVGADADLLVVDPDEARVVDGSRMQSRAGYSVYDGQTLYGWPRWVLSRGDMVLDYGTISAPAGRGRDAQLGVE